MNKGFREILYATRRETSFDSHAFSITFGVRPFLLDVQYEAYDDHVGKLKYKVSNVITLSFVAASSTL